MKTTDHVTDHATDHDCCEVSLIEQLKSVPLESREWIKDEKGSGLTNIPYGRYCQEAAEALQKAEAEVERLKRMVVEAAELGDKRSDTFKSRAEKAEASLIKINEELCQAGLREYGN